MDLYQELILDHSKHPHHVGLREPFEAEVHHVNPTCGDEVTLRVHVDRTEGAPEQITLQDVSYDALGCSISMASTSMLAEECIGRPLSEVFETFAAMRTMLTSKGTDPGDEEVVGDGIALAGVAQYPARVKCALLGWTAMVDALARAGVDISSTSQTTAAPTSKEQ
ncbi:Fe-S cluster assembly sulfur transfer protein SufU [Arsenicicoccus dermatophilus]|uniref:Fe-S cluster assembly sulfur transfer protein SufU n=1 Tax=Arsenicicoccus dermatophilus TaxID=1076331 RepID=UPI0039172B73